MRKTSVERINLMERIEFTIHIIRQGRRLKFFSGGAGFELLSELNWNFLCRFCF